MRTVEILLATYNGEKYLSKQLDSIMNQTFKDFEIIVRDDGSRDNTLQILDNYCKKYSNIRLIKDNITCGGAAKNFAILLENSKAEYVMFCDQDDIWIDNKIEKTINRMKEEERKRPGVGLLIHSDLKLINDNDIVIGNSFFKCEGIDYRRNSIENLFLINPVTGCTVMVNRTLLSGLLEIPYERVMHDHWLAIYASLFGEIITINEPLVLYRQHDSNVVGAYNYSSIKHQLKVIIAIKDYKKLVNNSFEMVEEILNKYSQCMDKKSVSKCTTFLQLKTCNLFEKAIIIMKNDYYRRSAFQKLRLFVLLSIK